MKVNLRQSGGIAGVDDRFDLNDTRLKVSKRGQAPMTRRLTKAEADKVAAAASRLLAKADGVGSKPAYPASDSMVTAVDIGDAHAHRRIEVASGQDAPDELWDLVDAMSEASRTS